MHLSLQTHALSNGAQLRDGHFVCAAHVPFVRDRAHAQERLEARQDRLVIEWKGGWGGGEEQSEGDSRQVSLAFISFLQAAPFPRPCRAATGSIPSSGSDSCVPLRSARQPRRRECATRLQRRGAAHGTPSKPWPHGGHTPAGRGPRAGAYESKQQADSCSQLCVCACHLLLHSCRRSGGVVEANRIVVLLSVYVPPGAAPSRVGLEQQTGRPSASRLKRDLNPPARFVRASSSGKLTARTMDRSRVRRGRM